MKKVFQMWVKCRWQHFCTHMSEEAMNWCFLTSCIPCVSSQAESFLLLIWCGIKLSSNTELFSMKDISASQPKGFWSWFLRMRTLHSPFCDRKNKSSYATTVSVFCFPRFCPWALQQFPIFRDFKIKMGYSFSSPCTAINLQAGISLREFISLLL